MKRVSFVRRAVLRSFVFAALAGLVSAWAQLPPVVTIRATDPNATWSGDTGTFTILRAGDPTPSLNVFYRIMGNAVEGTDYKTIGNWVQIPGGVTSNTVVITPIDNGQTNNKAVTLILSPSPTMPPVNYVIGNPSNATLVIRTEAPTNMPPAVRIATPASGSTFPLGVAIQVCAEANDLDGYVSTVEFFAGTNSIGVCTNNPLSASAVNPFCLFWTPRQLGAHTLSAVATDNSGASTRSGPVQIMVVSPLPVVNIYATDPIATEIPLVPPWSDQPQRYDPAVFTVTRRGDTNIALDVFYTIGGTAQNGVDYAKLTGTVTIPVGAYSADIAVAPIDDSTPEPTETVELTIQPPVCITIFPPPPGCYQVGPSNRAVAFIMDDDQSATNYPPVVRITSPANNSAFRQPVNIPIYAYAKDPDDAIAGVEFFAGSSDLGPGVPVTVSNRTTTGTVICPTNLFMLVWSNAPLGTFPLIAKATDSRGASAESYPVNVTVLPTPPQPTNPPITLVSIVATDPIAIEGTNCWVWPGVTNLTAAWTGWPTNGRALYTNCGPKNATFALRRMGPTNNALTVAYDIGGTATNGVDYLPLPGVATIGAGERFTLIPVVPIDDGLTDVTRTVVLKLKPSAAMPPEYGLGYPRSAAVLLIDSFRFYPRPGSRMLADRCFLLNTTGPDGAWFHVEYSTNMVNWQPICTNQVVNGFIDFVDPDAPEDGSRFYRAVPENMPPL